MTSKRAKAPHSNRKFGSMFCAVARNILLNNMIDELDAKIEQIPNLLELPFPNDLRPDKTLHVILGRMLQREVKGVKEKEIIN
jgi:hypothetical protein